MNIIPGEKYKGKVSSFGGPFDTGMKSDEGVAMYNKWEENESVFLNYQPQLLKTDPGYPGLTSGLGRRLDPDRLYCSMYWNYDLTPKAMLRKAQVRITFQDRTLFAQIVDFGPALWTKRLIDVSPRVMKNLDCKTDDEVECELIL